MAAARHGHGGGALLDVYLNDSATGTFTPPYPGSCIRTPAYILFSRRKEMPDVALVHELAHGAQYAHTWAADGCLTLDSGGGELPEMAR